MTKICDSTLARAFQQTDYRVLADGQWHTLTVGAACPAPLRTWLITHGNSRCAWIITAHNPQAEIADAQANAERAAALQAWLDAAGHTYTATDSCAHSGDWPSEPGVCVLDMDEGLARALALRFDQVAMIAVATEHTVKLVWVDG